jgi:hypothetical protein
LNRQALPSVTGLAGERDDGAKTEHGAAVADHRDQIAAGGQIVGFARVAFDRGAGGGDPGRIGER